jgi:hypothetical protein
VVKLDQVLPLVHLGVVGEEEAGEGEIGFVQPPACAAMAPEAVDGRCQQVHFDPSTLA